MRSLKLRGKMRRIQQELEEEAETAGELNLVPFLDITTNVVMFLLATVTFSASLSQLPVLAPKVEEGGAGKGSDQQQESLRLALAVTAKGIIVSGNDPLLDPDKGGKKLSLIQAGQHDWEALSELLVKLKDAHPAEKALIVVLDPDLNFETLVKVLDVSRASGEKMLFPEHALGTAE
jgi:biopolymer transport protein ExbD